ncbi:LLM class F420-dependent oxidoreductase [Tsukamurella sp. 8F]|uniref:LLM class F420-dependent oxidoreductase n=1 Tax=unclassified Tsukamurella TaxID=2633480 RepID=UPI0023BA3843|nr:MULTISPECIES: LLM class F420-dependent oxidoreductase [unclassified Tsukamurella]MDF0531195.1 LLM class F420-dependent oxidoreductase [Tsukamurella sp. 8J]MDF0585858.1 LLM class F420-dependent oxidoreductase [Tsukamurella sp. 8F]
MEFRVFVEPQQGATYNDQLAVARTAEAAGYGAFFRSDHYAAMNTEGLPGPTDSWVTLGGIARETSTIRLGTLVTSATFRFPGPLAISVAEVDQMSGGRVELGLGAGWFEREHAAYAIPFPDVKTRFDRFEETLRIVVGLWETPVGSTFDFPGEHLTVTDSPALPKPVQTPRPPIVLGGAAKKRGAALAAELADEFNVPFVPADEARAAFGRIDAACEARGRDPRSIVRSAALVLCAGPDEPTIARRAAAIGREVSELRENGLAGSAAEIVDKLGAYADAGVTRVYLQILDQSDLEHIEWVAAEVMPQL